MWDMLQNLFGRLPYVCRPCQRSFYSEHRHRNNLKGQPTSKFKPEPPPGTAFRAQRQGAAQAAVVIRTEDDRQLTRILRALSRAVEAEQQAAATL